MNDTIGNASPQSYHRESPAHFAQLYSKHNLRGGHVIKLGAGNEDAAKEALAAGPGKCGSLNVFFVHIFDWPHHPGGMQVGGGIDNSNAKEWLRHGASKVSDSVLLKGVHITFLSSGHCDVFSFPKL